MTGSHRNRADRRRGRWMGPLMVVLAGMSAGTAAAADTVEIPEWGRAFQAQGVSGAVAVRRLGDRRSFVSDLDLAASGFAPAATFATPHLLIALETGVVSDVRRSEAGPGSAGGPRGAAETVFQTIARNIGVDRMAAWLSKLGYGNASVSGGIDRFWTDGGLRISPVQQLDFVERLLLGTLPASGRAQTAARDSVPGERLGGGAVLRGRTGWVQAPAADGSEIGWWVGWVEQPRAVWLFSLAVEGSPERVREARRTVMLSVLDGLGIGGFQADAGPAAAVPSAILPARFPGR